MQGLSAALREQGPAMIILLGLAGYLFIGFLLSGLWNRICPKDLTLSDTSEAMFTTFLWPLSIIILFGGYIVVAFKSDFMKRWHGIQ